MNGSRVVRERGTIFVPLPRALWTKAGRCDCQYCGGDEAYYDTLAIAEEKPDARTPDTSWTVHHPWVHGKKPKVEKRSEPPTRF